jgi:CheY-like chemotaxis protein
LEARLRQADKMQALGSLAGGVAHDFNNLLTAILGGLRMAVEGRVDPERRKRLLGNALMAAERGAGLTQRLLSFARGQPLSARPTDANTLIDAMQDLLRRSLGGVTELEMRLQPGLWPALVDPEQLELAILNLCINARDAMPGGGTVTVTTRNTTLAAGEVAPLAAGEYVAISVRDTGQGMPREVLSRIFEPFFTTKEVGKGTGLGLSMVYGLAQQSGGTVGVDSAPGQGTTVEIFLPRCAATPAQPDARATLAPVAARPARILVVDDDPSVREVTAAFLRDLGHRVREAADGEAALRMLEQDAATELLVTDIAMPLMSGREVASRARAMRPGLPVLLVTGHADLAGVPDDLPILRKPFDPALLADLVARLTMPG